MRVALATALLMLAGCIHRQGVLDKQLSMGVQKREPPSVLVAEVPVHGHRVRVLQLSRPPVVGELLAVHSTVLVVMTDAGVVYYIPVGDVQAVRLHLMPVAPEHLGVWGAVGLATTPTHGGFLILTAPMWIVGTIAATALDTNASRPKLSGPDVAHLWQYARFPQGLPEGFDTTALPDRE
jgi:hypothetical protein